MSIDADDTIFDVVVNHEQQYAIWPTFQPIPEGWQTVGVQGDKATCKAHIDAVWTDMRPLSLRLAMGES